MTEILWLRGHTTATSARVLVCSDTVGDVTIQCNGGAFGPAAVDPAVAGGFGMVEIAGLSPDTEYRFTILHDGMEILSSTLFTFPEAGPVKIGWVSCQSQQKDMPIAAGIIDKHHPHAFLFLGDFIYCENAADGWGEAITTIYTDSSVAATEGNYYPFYRQHMRKPFLSRLLHGTAFYLMSDDHEWPGGNWDNVYVPGVDQCGANQGVNPNLVSSQAEVDAINVAVNAVLDNVFQANPDGNLVANQRDYSFKITDDVEVFVLDEVRNRSWQYATDDASKLMISAEQEAALLAGLRASTATFKIIGSTKKTLAGSAGVTDAWPRWNTQLMRILTAIHDGLTDGTWAVPGGVVWVAGDVHNADVHALYTDAAVDPAGKGGDSVDHVCVLAGTIAGAHHDQGAGYTSSERWKCFGQSGVGRDTAFYGMLTVQPGEYVDVEVFEKHRSIWSDGRVYAGSNALVYRDSSSGIAGEL